MAKSKTEEVPDTQLVEVELPPGMTAGKLQALLSKTRKAPVQEAEPVVFAEIENGHNKQIRVHRTVYKGRELLSIQNFYIDESKGPDWQFGKAITFDYELIDDIIGGLTKMKSWCEENPSEKGLPDDS